jgi:hypothetical protein
VDLLERIETNLVNAKNVLVLAVGGGNDSVSSLLLLRQLEQDFGFAPDNVVVAAMLPDVVDYSDLRPTPHLYVHEILPITSRWINKKPIEAFPEPLLAEHANSLGIEKVVGLDTVGGSANVAKALHWLIHREKIDTVIAVDVGGDFLAIPENLDVMSPMMDGYAAYALKAAVASNPGVKFLFSAFGLGTDGESTPEMLDKSLESLSEVHAGTFNNSDGVARIVRFYNEVIEPNRPSRTAALTIRSIQGFPIHRFTYQFRNRFYTQPRAGESKAHYAYFDHILDEEHTARYYLLDRVWDLHTPFAISTESSAEWFEKVQNVSTKLCHELNGQSAPLPGGSRAYFGTPPRRFEGEQRKEIMAEIVESIYNRVYPYVYVYPEDVEGVNLDGFKVETRGKLLLVGYEES